jgi:regulator of protease activity HflC (stomatin/prohibitin superfamily)
MGGTLMETILQNLMALLPFVIVRTYERGVRWTFGCNPTELMPGFHWKIWLLHQVETMPIVDEAIELPIQSVITADEKLVCFSVNIGYRVCDVVKHWNGVQDFHESTKALAMTHLAQRVRASKLADLVAEGGLKKLEGSAEGTLTTKFNKWGTEVFFVGFVNFAEVPRQMRIFTDAPTPGLHMGNR